jgi:hypothetical protein
MRTKHAVGYFSMFLLLGLYTLAPLATADTVAQFNVQIECQGPSNGQIAVRWGSPSYGQNQYITLPDHLFKTSCNKPTQTLLLPVPDQISEFQIQTQGGIETKYQLKASIVSPSNKVGPYIQINHDVSADATTNGTGFTLKRSSGPNKYGEQNFRVTLDAPGKIPVFIEIQPYGKPFGQVALRWGHPDFNDHGYIGVWKVKAGADPGLDPSVAKTNGFTLDAQKSEFEIQTEGGVDTSYQILIWLGFPGQRTFMPSITINHGVPGGTDIDSMQNDETFTPSKGNIYGEMNVGVHIPWVTQVVATPPPPTPGWSQVAMTHPMPDVQTYQGTIGLAVGGSGHFTQIQNDEGYPIELVGPNGTTADCGKKNPAKTAVIVANHMPMPSGAFSVLFGNNPSYPMKISGCVDAYPEPSAFQFSVWTVWTVPN